MNIKGLLTGLVLLLGGALLIYLVWFLFSFIECGVETLILNWAVASVVYLLLVWDVATPWIGIGDKGSRKVANLGIRWIVFISYSLAACIFAIVANFYCFPPLDFIIQMMVQGVLVLLLAGGILVMIHTGDKAAKVHQKESGALMGRQDMDEAARRLVDATLMTPDVPSEIAQRAERIHSMIRYISPSNNYEARKYEEQFCEIITRLSALLYDCKTNESQITQLFTNADRILQNRKNVLNN